MNETQQTPWLINSIIFCYNAEKHTGNDNKKKQHFFQQKGNHSNNKEAYTERSKSTERKVGFASVFEDITRRGALPEDTSIHTAEMSNERDRKKRRHKMGNIYRLAEFNACHREQQRKPSNIKSNI